MNFSEKAKAVWGVAYGDVMTHCCVQKRKYFSKILGENLNSYLTFLQTALNHLCLMF